MLVLTHENLFEKRVAGFSGNERYRYYLYICWNAKKGALASIGLNPSTATHLVDDPTIRRDIMYAKAWGYGGLLKLNVSAFRATNPKVMLWHGNIGVRNTIRNFEKWFEFFDVRGLPLACWGQHAKDIPFAKELKASFQLNCVATNKDGSPTHHLYQRKDAMPRPWNYVV